VVIARVATRRLAVVGGVERVRPVRRASSSMCVTDVRVRVGMGVEGGGGTLERVGSAGKPERVYGRQEQTDTTQGACTEGEGALERCISAPPTVGVAVLRPCKLTIPPPPLPTHTHTRKARA
jgi:hypothetical protein